VLRMVACLPDPLALRITQLLAQLDPSSPPPSPTPPPLLPSSTPPRICIHALAHIHISTRLNWYDCSNDQSRPAHGCRAVLHHTHPQYTLFASTVNTLFTGLFTSRQCTFSRCAARCCGK
jgi:hypothetical protein